MIDLSVFERSSVYCLFEIYSVVNLVVVAEIGFRLSGLTKNNNMRDNNSIIEQWSWKACAYF